MAEREYATLDDSCLDRVWRNMPDPRAGLPEAVFKFALRITPMINVDLLIKDSGSATLLAWREDGLGSGWHIPGGIIRFGEQSHQRIAIVADRELGATVESEAMPCDIIQFMGRRGHFISLLYRCRIVGEFRDPGLFDVTGDGPKSGTLAWIKGMPRKLYPSHEQYMKWLL